MLSLLTSRQNPQGGEASVFVFFYNVEKCCTVQVGGKLHPSQKKTHMGRKHILYLQLFQHKGNVDVQWVSMKNSLQVVSNIKQRLPWPPNLQISHLHIQIFDWTEDEWDSLSRTTIRLWISTWFSASSSSWAKTESTLLIFLKCATIVLSYKSREYYRGKGSVIAPSCVFSDKWLLVVRSHMEKMEIWDSDTEANCAIRAEILKNVTFRYT